MKKFLALALALLLLQSGFCFILFPFAVSAQMQETITNQSVIDMVKTGMSQEIVLAKIKSSKSLFDTSASALQKLKKAGVADPIILAMVQKASGIDMSASTSTNSSTPALNGTLSGTGGFGGGTTSVLIPDGTEIKVVTTEEISGKKVVEGDPLNFKVAEDVVINGKTVIAKNTVVKGVVSNAKKSGMMGRSGSLSVRIESTQAVDNQKIKLRASKSGEGGDSTGSTVALTVLFGPIGLLKKGKEAKMKSGTVLTAYTDESKSVMAAN